MRKLIAFLTGGTCVILQDRWYYTYYTIGYKKVDPFTKEVIFRAHVHWTLRIGDVILNEDGSTAGESAYVKRWMIG